MITKILDHLAGFVNTGLAGKESGKHTGAMLTYDLLLASVFTLNGKGSQTASGFRDLMGMFSFKCLAQVFTHK